MSFRCVSKVGDDTKRRGDNDVGGGLGTGEGRIVAESEQGEDGERLFAFSCLFYSLE